MQPVNWWLLKKIPLFSDKLYSLAAIIFQYLCIHAAGLLNWCKIWSCAWWKTKDIPWVLAWRRTLPLITVISLWLPFWFWITLSHVWMIRASYLAVFSCDFESPCLWTLSNHSQQSDWSVVSARQTERAGWMPEADYSEGSSDGESLRLACFMT